MADRKNSVIGAERGAEVVLATVGQGAMVTGAAALAPWMGAIPAIVGTLNDLFHDYRDARVEAWWTGIVNDPNWETPQEVQGLIESRIKTEPEAKETVLIAARQLVDSVTTEACTVIGGITAEYLRERKGPDLRFRGATRLLADLSLAEYKLLQAVVRRAVEVPERNPILHFKNGNQLHCSGSTGQPLGAVVTLPGSPLRVFRLIKANDLGSEPPSGSLDLPSGPPVLLPDHDSFLWLAKHLGVMPPQMGRQ